ncbi:MAG: replication-associated recombination protein A [Candidatus Roizmanbacteria bacterium]|nr:MAG: replication-associated recombination protein A [Candidatus Roizmanbacteria bacterium]
MCYNIFMNLSYRLRPKNLDEFVGQSHLVGKDGIIRKMIESNSLYSIIFWGPPGSGKTTLAKIIAQNSNSDFHILSAVSTGKEDLRKIIQNAQDNKLFGKRTVLFIDEIHRWNKAQQDALLPNVENGLITLIGATTENPSFEVISALLSRCRLFVLKSLEDQDLEKIVDKALSNTEMGVGKYKKKINSEAKELLIRLSGGDARIILNALEMAVTTYKEKTISPEIIKQVFQTKSAGIYDKKADEHYNIISAFIKSVRGSDPDAALYYLARMLENGEDPKFIARRMIILASEDIGMADRGALIQANIAFEAVHKVGMPEAQLILAHIVIYLAKAPKSRVVANALEKAKAAVYEFPNEPIPLHLRNATTKFMKNLGYAKDYKWSKDYVGPKSNLSFLPEKLKNKKFYEP